MHGDARIIHTSHPQFVQLITESDMAIMISKMCMQMNATTFIMWLNCGLVVSNFVFTCFLLTVVLFGEI